MTMQGPITEIEWQDNGGAVFTYDGWSLLVSADEMDSLYGFEPKAGDLMITGPSIGQPVQYIEIAGHVIRNISDAEQDAIREKMLAKFQSDREDRFAEFGDEWKETAAHLLEPLSNRIRRFVDEEGDGFWIEDGGYELFTLQSADVLARHAMNVYPGDPQKQIEWIEWWDSLNSKAHNYDYDRQQAILPEFGDGHSGNTHAGAVFYAKRVVRGEDC